ncbi:hypothetical protein GUJ93_ZPchr0006g44885 [Zizania palustris]|uniref:Uncharacterized protein n=1 Tax=Zizania palustris TaxID=103762 RepID=A0A8J5VKT2_ZIZPA|nr:hypothetical protein GUJ93_ZPchr0006g44885 [Zizania palustris]
MGFTMIIVIDISTDAHGMTMNMQMEGFPHYNILRAIFHMRWISVLVDDICRCLEAKVVLWNDLSVCYLQMEWCEKRMILSHVLNLHFIGIFSNEIAIDIIPLSAVIDTARKDSHRGRWFSTILEYIHDSSIAAAPRGDRQA